MTIEHWWNDNDRAKQWSTNRNTCRSAYIHYKSHMDWPPRLNPGLCGKKPVTDCLSHGTAFVVVAAAVVVIVATTTAATLVKYFYTKYFI